ncbi:MAG TPA: UDP-2,3-diacylglucosamine diphosphatase [Gammaproteobacteria bacterium]|nr:UDP-2,3-diacylglucosamine diphosphatase [Gammaproteobacteria bacterium]
MSSQDPHTLFISDLHLHQSRPGINDLFRQFAEQDAVRADAVYILGDLFEFWYGDDDDDPLNLEIQDVLASITAAGTPVFFIHGNRDFLLGTGFENKAGVQCLAEETVIDLYGTPTLVMHGDSLCTDDHEYMKFREMVRNPANQKAFMAMPLSERRKMATDIRQQSQQAMQLKANDITDVNDQAVEQAFRRNQVQRLIHGHTHRPAIHDLTIDQHSAQRYVLGDWYDQGSLLYASPTGLELRNKPLSE